MFISKEEKNWAAILHLSMLSSALIPLAGIALPVAIWAIKGKESDYINTQGKRVINFMISFSIFSILVLALAFGLPAFFASPIGFQTQVTVIPPLGLVALVILMCIGVVFPIVAAVRCAAGEDFKYPYTIGFIK